MKREIKFSLVFRDMWQSAGKYVPTVDQLTRVAPAIIEMGCFARVETNGGGFEQVNLLFGENPNKAVREWTKPFHAAGIQTHMLDRALNGLRMSPVPDDVRQLFYKVKKAQGTDIARTFCGLNDVRNIAPSIKYAKEAGMISQCSLCITHSPVHTVEYYTKMAFELIELGADEICIKDMAGIGRPYTLGRIVANIKEKYPEIPIQYHSHAGPGFNVASIMEVCNAGCDYIDVGMEPLSWGTGHADLLTVQAMLKDAGYKVPEINMEAYMKVRALVQEFMDDFLGLYISPKNRLMNSLLIGPGLPGGMMGSLMADLEKNLETINKSNIKKYLFTGYKKSYYPANAFDSDTERLFSIILEEDPDVIRWIKPPLNQLGLFWKAGQQYNPDFLVETTTGKYMVEVKALNEVTSDEVVSKAREGIKWCQFATTADPDHKKWEYKLISDDNIQLGNTCRYILGTAHAVKEEA